MSIELIYGDCLEKMQDIPDGSVDLILTDPPYGISYKSHVQSHQREIINDTYDKWYVLLPLFLKEFRRILADTGVCCCCCSGGGRTPSTAILTLEAMKHLELIQTLVWRKTIGLGWRYRPSYENIIVLAKDMKNYNFFDKSKKCSNVIEGINKKIPRKGEHPTVKPVVLMEYLLRIHSIEGMAVLDPFMGSGTTGVACKNLNRSFIGIELDLEYFKIAERRINETTPNII